MVGEVVGLGEGAGGVGGGGQGCGWGGWRWGEVGRWGGGDEVEEVERWGSGGGWGEEWDGMLEEGVKTLRCFCCQRSAVRRVQRLGWGQRR